METLKHFACPQCNLSYTARESRPHQSRLPLILSCGHSLCEGCIRKSAKDHKAVICPCCHKILSLKDGDEDILKLPPDIHVLGVLALSYRKPTDLNVRLVPAGHKCQQSKAVLENDCTVICDECNKSAAHWSCDKCTANFCNICFDLIHRGSKLMKKHEGKPLYVEEYRSIIQSGCAKHDSRSVEFYCEDDDQVVCSYCVVMGDHKGHSVISLVEKNQSCTDDLRCAIAEGQKFRSRLKLTEKKLSELIPEEKIDTALLAKEVHSRFHTIHGLLQLRELEIIKELESLSSEHITLLEKMRQEASDQLKQLTALIRDAEKVLNNSFIPINVVDVLKNLHSAKEIPCHLVPTENAENRDDIKIEFDQNFIDGIPQFGKVEADIKQKYKLCSDAELPPDYKVEETDDDLLLNTDTESLNSSMADDISTHGSTPLHTPDSQKLKISPFIKPKKATVLTQEIVFVTHIKDPDHFYVQRFSEVKKLQNLSENINKWCRSRESSQQVPKVLTVGDLFLVQYGLDKKWYRARVLRILPSAKDPGRAMDTGEQSENMQNVNNEVNRNLSEHSNNGNSLGGEVILHTSGNNTSQSANFSPTDNQESLEEKEAVQKENMEEMESSESYSYTSCESQNTSEGENGNLPQNVHEQRNLCADPVTSPENVCDNIRLVADLPNFEDTKQDIIVSGESRVEVLYVDFGNTEVVPQSRLRSIQPKFLSLSWQALRCALWDIVPSDKVAWSQKAIKLFAQFVANKQVRMKVIEQRNDILYVDLCETETDNIKNEIPISVRDALVFLEVACFPSPHSIDKKMQLKRKYFPPDQFRPGQKLNVVLSHLENPGKFFVQQLGGSARHLSNLIFQMQEKFSDSKKNLHAVYAPRMGMAVVGKFSVDKNWYRAEIIGLPGDSNVEVRYVDFGNTEVLPYWDLHKIPDDCMKLPAQAISCSLSDVAPPQGKEWSDECKQFMMEVAGKGQLSMKVNRTLPGQDTVLVSLFKSEDDNDVCINGLLVECKLAVSTGPQSAKVTIPRLPSSAPPAVPISKTGPFSNSMSKTNPMRLTSEEKQSNNDISPNEEKNMEKEPKKKVPFIPVHVSNASSPDSVYVQLATKEGERLDGLMNQLQQIYSKSQVSNTDWKESTVCAVLSSRDKRWYRGRILKKLENGSLQVRFLDYGTTETVSTDDIRPLVEQFHVDPTFAIKCHFAGVRPAGGNNWSNVACEALSELLSAHETLYLTKKGEIKNSSLPIDLLVEEVRVGGALEPSIVEYTSIVQQLLDKGLAIPTRNVQVGSSNLISPGKNQNVTNESLHPTEVKYKASLTNKMKWKPTVMPKEREMMVIPTQIGENGTVFLHRVGVGSDTLHVIKNALQVKFQNSEFVPPSTFPEIGEACIAKFCLDKNWYRAEVTKVLDNSIEVLFVDYGNREVISLQDIRLEPVMMDIPRQCLECELDGIKPTTDDSQWPVNVLDFIHETIVEKMCTMKIKTLPEPEKPLRISLALPGGLVLEDILIEMGFAKKVEFSGRTTCNTLVVDDEMLSTVTPSGSDEIKVEMVSPYLYPKIPEKGKIFPVVVTNCVKPNEIYIQRLKLEESSLDEEKLINQEFDGFLVMMEELGENGESFPVLRDLEQGQACCAMYSYDDRWYRGLIKAVSSLEVEVLYIDYGNSEIIPKENFNRLRELPIQYFMFPVQALHCKLNRLSPVSDSWSQEALVEMVDILFNNSLKFWAKVCDPGPPLEIHLYTKNLEQEMTLVYQSLIDKNLMKLDSAIVQEM